MPPDPVQLEYAPPVGGRGRWVRKVLIGVFVLLGFWSLAEWGPTGVRAVRLYVAQGRCADFEYPAGTVVYENDGVAGERLLASGDYAAVEDTSVWPGRAVVRREPGCWASLKGMMFTGRVFWPPGPAAPKAMVHRLRNGAGEERLVAVIVAPPAPVTGVVAPREVGLVAAIVRPGRFGEEPRWEGNGPFLRAGFEKAGRFRVFAAVLDPGDPSKFSVRYEMDGDAGTIDGKLDDRCDVVLTIRDGPATAVVESD